MHYFSSENQIFTEKAIFGVESLKTENPLLKNLQLKTRV